MNWKNQLFRKSSVVIILLATIASVLVPSIAPQAKVAFAQQQDEDVSFVSNVEMIRGHIMMAVANKEKNDLALAQAHSTHPIAELYTLIESEVQKGDGQLNTQLKSALSGLSEKAKNLPAADFKAEADRINSMLDQAVRTVVPDTKRNDVKFNVNVIGSILSGTNEDYGEAIKDGKIEAMVDYQDAQSFSIRAESIFNSIANQISEQERNEAKELFAKLKTSISNVQDPATIKTQIDELVAEINEGAGVKGQASVEITSTQYIENARQLLKQVSSEYKKGNVTGAEKLAVIAYLENYENVESELVNRGSKDLVDETEQLMRVQLREMIQNKVTQEQLDAHISKINEKLDQAAVVVPEFPVGVAIVMASVTGLVIAISRFRGSALLGRGFRLF